MKDRICLAIALMAAIALGWLRSYEVLPTRADWSGKVDGNPQGGGVGEQFTANFDSITEVSLFTGGLGAGQNYDLRVRDAETDELVAHQYNKSPAGDHRWLKFDSIIPDGKFVRGREYVARFTRPGDSINWYKSALNKYHYGQMVRGGTGLQPPEYNDDLCARIYGLARVGNEFAVQSNVAWTTLPGYPESIPYMSPAAWDDCVRREAEVGAKYDKIGYGFWGYIQRSSPSQFVWGWLDTQMASYANHGVRPIMSFRGTPGWATCAFESVAVNHVWIGRPHGGAIPRGLYEGVLSDDSNSINPDNYYAKYIYEFVRRYGPLGTAFNGSQSGTFWREHTELPQYIPILLYEGFPEVPSGGLDRYWERPGLAGGYWRLDEPLHYHFSSPSDSWPHRESLIDPVYRETLASHIPFGGLKSDTTAGRKATLAKTYARLVIVVDSAVKMACTSPLVDSARPRSLAYVSSDGDDYYTMHDWLTRLKSYRADEFFDVASLWGYAGVDYPRDHDTNLQHLRRDLDDAGYDPRPCVFTEFGTSCPYPWSQHRRAYHLFEAYPFIQTANVIPPGYPVLACAWFTFTEQFMTGHNWSIIDDSAHDWQSWQPACAYQQWSSLTQGASFEGKIAPWDNPGDTIYGAQVFQYRDSAGKRFWTAWQPMDADWSHASILRVPARADTESACGADTSGSPIGWIKVADTSGWLVAEFDTLPVIVFEGQNRSRPELVVDSFWVKPYPPVSYCSDTFFVRIKNRDAETWTPINCATWVHLTWNGNLLDSMRTPDMLGPNATRTLSLHRIVPGWMCDSGLLAANVNPGMRYVEREGTDDNMAYLRLFVPYNLIGTIDAITPPGGQTDPPLLPMRLTSNSWGTDTLGQESADSARIVFFYWGQRDSVAHATDTTAWFPFCADTALEFPRGCGKYTLQVRFRDSGAVESQFFGDSTDSIVVFDSMPPAGSIVVEGGRFASNSTRTLLLAASDSASGVCDMRFMNRGRVNLARNGAFDPAGGYWSFAGTGSGYDTSLSMGVLSVGPTQAGVRQFVPAESISAYSGDSCVLEASILAHVHDGEATGDVSFWHFRTNENPEITDTLWELVDSASYTGDLLSLTGRYNLSTRFLLSTPAPESGWVWRGGMVKVRAQGVDGGTGTVWCDNVLLNAYEPQAGDYAWYGPFETLSVWDIGSAAGQQVVGMCLRDSAGAENATPYADTVILDPTPPVVDISMPMPGLLVNGLVAVMGVAYDTVEVPGDSWFQRRTLSYRQWDSTNWLPVSPDSVSYQAALPDSMSSQGPAVHLGNWNTLPLPNGPYNLLLTACDSAGNTSSCTTWVMVDHGFGGGGMRSGPEGGGSGLGEGSVFVGSATGTVLHLSEDLDSLDAFSVDDSGSQANITAIVEVGEDSILVLDAHNKRVHKLHRSGQHRRRLVSGLSEPTDLKRDTNGNLYLVDRGLHRIGKFRSNGTLVFIRGGLGADSLHFNSPEGIALKGGLVYVADGGNNRVAVWDTSGHFKTTITGDFENPTAVWVMESGAIYLTDGTDGRLKGITPLGGNIVSIGTTDSSKLKGLVPSQNRHSLFSLASEPNKVYKLRIQSDESQPGGAQSGGRVSLPKTLALNQPFPNPARSRLNIAYALPRQTRVELKLYDVAGKLVTTLANGEQKPGYYNVTWNRQDTKGRSCACGVYFCTLAAENKRFSRKVILTE